MREYSVAWMWWEPCHGEAGMASDVNSGRCFSCAIEVTKGTSPAVRFVLDYDYRPKREPHITRIQHTIPDPPEGGSIQKYMVTDIGDNCCIADWNVTYIIFPVLWLYLIHSRKIIDRLSGKYLVISNEILCEQVGKTIIVTTILVWVTCAARLNSKR